jgi:hypothetical protein
VLSQFQRLCVVFFSHAGRQDPINNSQLDGLVILFHSSFDRCRLIQTIISLSFPDLIGVEYLHSHHDQALSTFINASIVTQVHTHQQFTRRLRQTPHYLPTCQPNIYANHLPTYTSESTTTSVFNIQPSIRAFHHQTPVRVGFHYVRAGAGKRQPKWDCDPDDHTKPPSSTTTELR